MKNNWWLVKLWAKGSYLGYRIDVLNWQSGVTLNPADCAMVKLWAKGSYLGYRIDVLNWALGVALNPAEFIGKVG